MARFPPRKSNARTRFLVLAKALYRKDPEHFSQAVLAKAAGVSRVTICNTFGGKDAMMAEVKTACGVPLTPIEEVSMRDGPPRAPEPVPLMAEAQPQRAQPQRSQAPREHASPPSDDAPRRKRSKRKPIDDDDESSASTQDAQEDPFSGFPPVNAPMSEHYAFASSTGLGLVLRRVLRDPTTVGLGKDFTTMLSNMSKCIKEQLDSSQPSNLTGETVVYKDILPDNGRDENTDNVIKMGKLLRKIGE